MQRAIAIISLVLLAALLAACPRGGTGGPAGGPTAGKPGAAPAPAAWHPKYPAEPMKYVLAALKQPTQPGYPPLGPSWLVLAQLDSLDQRSAGAEAGELRTLIEQQVKDAKGNPPPELACAWLSCQPRPAAAYIAAQLNAGKAEYAIALSYKWPPQLLRQLKPLEFPTAAAQGVLNSIESRGHLETNSEEFYALLKGLAEHSDELVRLRAIGCLLVQGQASEEQLQYLKDTLKAGKESLIPAATEAVRFSRDETLTDSLVALVANVKLGDEGQSGSASADQLFGSNALAFLSGGQAEMMRSKLLGAVDPLVRWQARLGQLMNGQPKPWYDALAAKGIADSEMWITLQTPDAAAMALLHTYELAAASADAPLRLQAAQQLNRSPAYASNPLGLKLLQQLAGDKEAAVREAGWYTCARLVQDEGPQWLPLQALADEALADTAQQPQVRLAAVCFLLKWAEQPPPQQPAAGAQ